MNTLKSFQRPPRPASSFQRAWSFGNPSISLKRSVLVGLGILWLGSAGAWAQTFSGTYTFTGTTGNVSSFAYNGTDILNLTESALTKNGVTTSSSSGNFRATAWTTGATIDTTDYFEFSLTADTGFEIDMTSILFGIGRSATGPVNWEWRSSADGFASTISTYTTVNAGLTNTSGVLTNPDANSSWTGNELDLSAAAFQGESTLTFRFYGYASEAGTGSGGFQGPLTFSGELIALSGGNNLYWLGSDTNRGGSGTWANTGGTAWSTTDADVAGVAWDSTKTAIFNTAVASVTVSGTVDADKGITFDTGTNGSTISGGTAIDLGGATAVENTITAASGITATIGTDLTGSTGMTKAGSGTLVFTGDKTYTGGTTISAGILQLGNGTDGNVASGTAITNNAALAVNNVSAQSITGNITGTGTLTKSGVGVLTLGGTNSYSGGTTVSAGGLTGTNTSLQGAITNNAAVTFDQGTDGTYAGAMTGSGSLTKEGAGTVTLSGANLYSGGTTVTAGGLTGTTSSLQGAITNNAAVTFDQSTSGTYAGAMTGSGSLTKTGTGNVTVSGANSYTGGTTVSGGTLTGTTSSLQGAITNNAAVAFNQATDGTYAGAMSGAGSLAKSGTGEVTLTGNNSFLGGTTVSGGELVAGHNNALGTGTATVTNGSLFAGSGVTIANDIVVNATTGGSLLITQYYEGSSNNKWIEITNIGGSSINLDTENYRVALWSNADTENYKTDGTPTTTNALSGTLGAGQSLLLRNSGATTPTYAVSGSVIDSTINFNGDDSFVLFTGSTFATSNIVDAIGFTDAGNEGTDTSFVRTTTTSGFNLTAGSGVLDFASVWSQFTNAAVDSALAGSEERLGFSSLTGGGSGSATLGSNITSGTATFTGGVTLNSDVILTAAAGGTSAFNGVIADGTSGDSVTVSGAGKVLLNGVNTYTGTTSVASGATLGGVGSIGGDATFASGSTLAPGTTTGNISQALEFTTLTMDADSFWLVDLVNAITNDSDMITVNTSGGLSISGALTINEVSGLYTLGTSYRIASYTGTLGGAGVFSNDSGGFISNGVNTWAINYNDGGFITLNSAAVPEPGTITLLGLGLGGLIARRIRKRKAAQAA